MKKLSTPSLLQGILYGAQEVINHKDELNEINVFPVADGDTGSNLSILMQTILDQVMIEKETSLNEGMKQIAEAALVGARGNSGMIFAQYLQGLAQGFSSKKGRIQQRQISEASYFAVTKAYEAVLEPKEGTILSVMRSWSEYLQKTIGQEESLEKSLINARLSVKSALDNTQFQLTVLKKNHLVDAGAKGFYYFISGLTDSICEGKIAIQSISPYQIKQQKVTEHHFTKTPLFRYCSEFIIKNIQCSLSEVKLKVASFGNSLVLIGDTTQAKLHIHTNQPEKIMKALLLLGTITYQKVDDMLLQYEVARQPRSSIAIVTDSVADLPIEYILKHQIHVLPLNIILGEQNFLDKLTIDREYLQKKIQVTENLKTAQPSIKVVDALLSFLETKYEHVLIITVSSRLSGTYQLIKQRIQEKKLAKNWIQVIDSQLNSIAQGLLVRKAVEFIEQKEPFLKVVEQIAELRKQIIIYVAVADLNPMIHSGRIPQFLGKFAQKLSLHPIITLSSTGAGKLIGGAFTQQQSIAKITKKIQKERLEEIVMTHVFDEEAVSLWKEQLAKQNILVQDVVECSATIAISAGQSSIAIAGIRKE